MFRLIVIILIRRHNDINVNAHYYIIYKQLDVFNCDLWFPYNLIFEVGPDKN